MVKKLTGIQIYKLLPKTNCGDCNLPTCMAFAMQVAAKKLALESCPHVSEEAKTALGEAQAPPMQTVKIGKGDKEFTMGGETVLFRHEEKFHHPTGIALRVPDSLDKEELHNHIQSINQLHFERAGETIGVNLVAVEHCEGDGKNFAEMVKEVLALTDLPLILLCSEATPLQPALEAAGNSRPLIGCADGDNWEEMASLAAQYKVPLSVRADTIEDLAELTVKIKEKGVEEMCLDLTGNDFSQTFTRLIMARRLSLEKSFRPLGYPTLVFPQSSEPFERAAEATASMCKYGGIVVMDKPENWELLPILTVRQNIYTDPQVPNAIEARLYKIGDPGPESPLLLTTNFALTYFTVAGEVESSKIPCYVSVVDTGGLGVLNAYADDKLTPELAIKAVQDQGAFDQVQHKKIIIPGLVAVLRMEIQEETGWDVIIGPEEAAGLPSFLRHEWSA